MKFIDYGKSFRDTRLYFWFLLTICQFYAGNELQKDERHRKVTFNFDQLRKIEESLRNGLAHEITNLRKKKFWKLPKAHWENLTSLKKSFGCFRILYSWYEEIGFHGPMIP